MPLATLQSRTSSGIDAPPVTVEVHLTRGIPSLSIVGLPETAVKESKDRVRSAIINSGFKFPPRRITVNLAPADLPKRDGGRFDLAIALGILIANELLPLNIEELKQYEFAGELGLNGELRSFSGALPFSIACYKANHSFILPQENAAEASLPSKVQVLAATNLLEVCDHLLGTKILKPYKSSLLRTCNKTNHNLDLKDVYGQELAKRALEIAAAGRHNLLMRGPPGTGKTMLAQRIITILPNMSENEALEVAAINSLLGKPIDLNTWRQRPFRAPHHSASSVALVGGSSPPKPGEISLAHNGVLFLDELPEFSRAVLETLREPLESGHITISRAAYQAEFPSKIQLITAMNPCPCGNSGNPHKECRCTPEKIERYQTRISGPFLDRIDMHVQVSLPPQGFFEPNTEIEYESSATIKKRVQTAQQIQFKRSNKLNADLNNHELKQYCQLNQHNQKYLIQAAKNLNLSMRALHRILKVSRTIADLNNSETIQEQHLKEALSYRKI